MLKTPFEWEIEIPILKNPLLWFQMGMAVSGAVSFLALLLVGLNLFEDDWEQIPGSVAVGLIVGGGIFAAMSLILAVMYWRGIPTRYIVQDGHIEQHTLTGKAGAINRAGALALLSGSGAGVTAAGSGALARSREAIAVGWTDVTETRVFPSRREIQLHNDWRTIMQVVCPVDQFDEIRQYIQKATETDGRAANRERTRETPFAQRVILSIFSLVFGILLLPRLPIHYVGLFTIATVIAALLSLWSSGVKRRVFGVILSSLPVVGVGLAYLMDEVDMGQPGARYALAVELLVLGFFLVLGVSAARKETVRADRE